MSTYFCSTAETSKPNVLFLTPLILSCHMVEKILWCWVGSISRPLLLRKQFKADSTLSEVNQMYYHRTIRKIIRALNCGCNCMAICAVINKLTKGWLSIEALNVHRNCVVSMLQGGVYDLAHPIPYPGSCFPSSCCLPSLPSLRLHIGRVDSLPDGQTDRETRTSTCRLDRR